MSNILKSIGGDFNLNSVLSVNMMMILGAYRFCIKNSAYQTLKRVTEYNWQSHNRIGNNPALQFVGNPYVYGGTSLTNGADCSGFTQSVYAQFGYSLPRTSYEQQNWGTEVSYADAQPGDLICYGGHVAIYMGNGQIVHASNSRDGIKISNDATYRTILSVRRPS